MPGEVYRKERVLPGFWEPQQLHEGVWLPLDQDGDLVERWTPDRDGELVKRAEWRWLMSYDEAELALDRAMVKNR